MTAIPEETRMRERKDKRKPLVPRSREVKEAMALEPLIDAVENSVDRFRVLFEEGGNLDAAVIDLKVCVEDLEDALDKCEVSR